MLPLTDDLRIQDREPWRNPLDGPMRALNNAQTCLETCQGLLQRYITSHAIRNYGEDCLCATCVEARLMLL